MARERWKPSRWAGTVARRARLRMLATAALSALVTLFAVLNVEDVDVNWILGTWSTPLIVVIAASVFIGACLDRLMVTRRRRGRARKS